jgi:hypothetical protein
MLEVLASLLIERLRLKNYTHENTGAGHNFYSTNAKCESIPKPPYLSGIVTYEDDQTAILHRDFELIYFPVSKNFFAAIFNSNCRDEIMIRRTLEQMGVSCVYESCTSHRPQSREAQNFRPLSEIRPVFPGISSAQTTPLSAAAPSLHRFLAHIPEPQFRVPNSAHLPLIAGISSFKLKFKMDLKFFLRPANRI